MVSRYHVYLIVHDLIDIGRQLTHRGVQDWQQPRSRDQELAETTHRRGGRNLRMRSGEMGAGDRGLLGRALARFPLVAVTTLRIFFLITLGYPTLPVDASIGSKAISFVDWTSSTSAAIFCARKGALDGYEAS